MKSDKVALVAEWDGWCGACAAERPLVLTRTGRQRLRTWLTGAADDSRPLVLTCRLCGKGVDVPLAQDDPPVDLTELDHERQAAVHPAADAVCDEAPATALTAALTTAPAAAPAAVAVEASDMALLSGRQAVARALGALASQRSATATTVPVPRPAPVLAAESLAPSALPLQRTAPSGGLAELQLLADGIDLLSSGRS